jgi:hypothetical protein
LPTASVKSRSDLHHDFRIRTRHVGHIHHSESYSTILSQPSDYRLFDIIKLSQCLWSNVVAHFACAPSPV